MTRAHFRDNLLGPRADGSLVPLAGALVRVRQTGTLIDLAVPIYAGPSGGATLANPLTTDAAGGVEFWLDTDETVDLYVTATGYAPDTVTVTVGSQETLTAPHLIAPVVDSGGMVVNGGLIVGAGGTTLQSGLAFGGTGARVTGDFSNGTHANRVLVQSSTPNGNTNLGVIPNGTATIGRLNAYGQSDPDNATVVQVFVTGTTAVVDATKTGTGAQGTLQLRTGGATRVTIGAAGELGFFGAAAVAKPTVTGSRGANAALASLLTALASLGLVADSSS